jgi:hypothetical protein
MHLALREPMLRRRTVPGLRLLLRRRLLGFERCELLGELLGLLPATVGNATVADGI